MARAKSGNPESENDCAACWALSGRFAPLAIARLKEERDQSGSLGTENRNVKVVAESLREERNQALLEHKEVLARVQEEAQQPPPTYKKQSLRYLRERWKNEIHGSLGRAILK